MHFFVCSLFLFSTSLPVFGHQRVDVKSEFSSGIPSRQSRAFLRWQSLWQKRSPSYEISECVFVASEEKHYIYEAASDSEKVCGIYFFTDPDKVIRISFDSFDVPCEHGGLVSYVDGWELNGELFPGVQDHEKPLSERFQDFCGRVKPKSVLLTSQNAGMLHYRLPSKGTSFSFNVKFIKVFTPCNIFAENQVGIYTLKNYGRSVNCSVMALFPAKINVLALEVGNVSLSSLVQKETVVVPQCDKKRKGDFLEVGGSEGLDSSKLLSYLTLCGLDSTPENEEVVIGCGVTVVKLVSSGEHLNSATFALAQAEDHDLVEPSLFCPV